jgi:hypothetical protein
VCQAGFEGLTCNVTLPQALSSGMSSGAVVGIAVACVLLGVLLVVVILVILRRRQNAYGKDRAELLRRSSTNVSGSSIGGVSGRRAGGEGGSAAASTADMSSPLAEDAHAMLGLEGYTERQGSLRSQHRVNSVRHVADVAIEMQEVSSQKTEADKKTGPNTSEPEGEQEDFAAMAAAVPVVVNDRAEELIVEYSKVMARSSKTGSVAGGPERDTVVYADMLGPYGSNSGYVGRPGALDRAPASEGGSSGSYGDEEGTYARFMGRSGDDSLEFGPPVVGLVEQGYMGELVSSRLRAQRVLGMGEFGCVILGSLSVESGGKKEQPVVIKTLRRPDGDMRRSAEAEAALAHLFLRVRLVCIVMTMTWLSQRRWLCSCWFGACSLSACSLLWSLLFVGENVWLTRVVVASGRKLAFWSD